MGTDYAEKPPVQWPSVGTKLEPDHSQRASCIADAAVCQPLAVHWRLVTVAFLEDVVLSAQRKSGSVKFSGELVLPFFSSLSVPSGVNLFFPPATRSAGLPWDPSKPPAALAPGTPAPRQQPAAASPRQEPLDRASFPSPISSRAY